MAEQVRASFECKLYYKTGGNWAEIKIAQDVDIDESPDMIEASSRSSSVKRYIAGLIEGKISFKILAIDGETVYGALQTLARAKTPVELAWTDGDNIATTGTVYGRDWFLLSWKKGEPLNGMPTVDIEASPTVYFSSGSVVERSFVTAT